MPTLDLLIHHLDESSVSISGQYPRPPQVRLIRIVNQFIAIQRDTFLFEKLRCLFEMRGCEPQMVDMLAMSLQALSQW